MTLKARLGASQALGVRALAQFPTDIQSGAGIKVTPLASGSVRIDQDFSRLASNPTAFDAATATVPIQLPDGMTYGVPASSLVVSGGSVTKASLGLDQVDNTSDLTKPINTATQTALNQKAPLASPTFTGTLTAGVAELTKTAATNDTLVIPNLAHTLKVERLANYTGGANNGVSTALWVNTEVAPNAVGKQWGLYSGLYNNAIGDGNNNENVAIYGQARKANTSSTWAGVFECRDIAATANPTSSIWGIELDLMVNYTDNNLRRKALNIIYGNHDKTLGSAGSAAGEVGYGIIIEAFPDQFLDDGVTPSNTGLAKIRYPIAVSGTVTGSGINLLSAVFTGFRAPAIQIPQDTYISLDAADHHQIGFDNAAGIAFRLGGGTAMAFNDSGDMSVIGSYAVQGVRVVGARNTGWTAMTGAADEATAYAVGSVTLPQLAGRVKALQDALTTHGLIGT